MALGDIMEEEDVFEVELIEKERIRGGRKQYLVKWKGYPISENSWEPASSILDPGLIGEFKCRMGKMVHARLGAKRAAIARRATKQVRKKAPSMVEHDQEPTRQQPRRRAAEAAIQAVQRNQDEEDMSDGNIACESENDNHVEPPVSEPATILATPMHEASASAPTIPNASLKRSSKPKSKNNVQSKRVRTTKPAATTKAATSRKVAPPAEDSSDEEMRLRIEDSSDEEVRLRVLLDSSDEEQAKK